MSDHITVNVTCPACSHESSRIKLPDNATDDSTAHCEGCGAELGRYGDIKARAMELAKEEAARQFRNAFKGVKGWKVK